MHYFNISAPESPPQNVKVVVLNSTSLNISWQPPTDDKRNGIIDHYTVYLKVSKGKEKQYNYIKNTYVVLGSLKSATEYSLKVSASTTAGEGTHSGYVSRITNQGKQCYRLVILGKFQVGRIARSNRDSLVNSRG